jgi:hypothetical protein
VSEEDFDDCFGIASTNNKKRSSIRGQQHISSLGVKRTIPLLTTQEVMLFMYSHVLSGLVRDSYKVREILKLDLRPSWVAIIGVLNLICPRPKQVHSKFREKDIKQSQESLKSTPPELPVSYAAATSAKGKSKKSSNTDGAITKIAVKPSPLSQSFSSMFGMFRRVSSTQESSSDSNDKERVSVSAIGPDFWQNDLKIFEYGKPRHGLTRATWNMVVSSRMAIEDIISAL